MARQRKYESGNILASSLLVMLAVNLLAVTLVQTSLRENKVADHKVIDSTNFYLAESCTDNIVTWFKTFDKAPTTLPYTITRNDITHLYSGTESQSSLNQLSKYSYNCTVNSLVTKSVEASNTNIGENVSSSDAYGLSGDLRPKYFYQVESYGNGPSSSRKRLLTIVSVEY